MNILQSLLGQYRGLRRENYILFFGRIVTNLGSMIYPVLTLILSQKMGMDATQVALVTTVSGIVILPAGIIGGRIADRYNKKNAIIICDIVSIVLFLVCGCMPLSMVSIVLLTVASAFQSAEGPVYNALIADITVSENREKAYSLMYLGANLGLALSPMIAGILFKDYLWLSFILSGLSIGCSTVLIALQVKDISKAVDRGAGAAYQEEKNELSLWTLLRQNKVLLLYAVITGVYYAVYGQYSYIMPLDMGKIHGEDSALLFGTVSSLNCIEVVVLTPILTALFRKCRHTVKSLMGIVLVLSGYVTFLIFLGYVPFYYVAMSLFTLGEILHAITDGPYTSNRMPASHRGRINGFITTLQGILYGIVMMVLGLLYDNMGSVAAWLLIFGLLGVAVLGCIIMIPLDKKRYPDLY